MRGYYFIIIFSAFAVACNYSVSKNEKGNNISGGLDAKKPITWTTVQASALDTCVRCHSGANSPALSSKDLVIEHYDDVLNEVISKSMPPKSKGYVPLSACQIAILKKWQELKFPETSTVTIGSLPECVSSSPVDVVPISALPATYANLEAQILKPYCLHCHNPDSSDFEASAILLSPYDVLIAKKNLLKDGANSKLVKILKATDDDRMPPPEEGAGLTDEEIDFVIRWLEAGMPR
ncbi:MAG: hypothetical protein H6623_06505 [Bdellovibrionaceae bacterium]|nr:hypothetical protein [Pseudobdellovibrionaceae bacterium]